MLDETNKLTQLRVMKWFSRCEVRWFNELGVDALNLLFLMMKAEPDAKEAPAFVDEVDSKMTEWSGAHGDNVEEAVVDHDNWVQFAYLKQRFIDILVCCAEKMKESTVEPMKEVIARVKKDDRERVMQQIEFNKHKLQQLFTEADKHQSVIDSSVQKKKIVMESIKTTQKGKCIAENLNVYE
jgi:hypothetical protein